MVGSSVAVSSDRRMTLTRSDSRSLRSVEVVVPIPTLAVVVAGLLHHCRYTAHNHPAVSWGSIVRTPSNRPFLTSY
eukprot:1130792-Prorocentrum_minimum.AAC.5